MPSCSASDRNFTTGASSTPPSRTRIHTRPAAPSDLARSMSASSLRAAHVALAATRNALHRLRARERLEVGRLEDLGEVDELHAEARVGLVGAVALHRVEPRHARDRPPAPRHRAHRVGRREHRGRRRGEHVFLVGEGHLDVELHELELAVGAEVFVAEATRDLEVAVEAADHQQLLEQLRALRQRVERARPQPRRHDEVARAFRRRRDQHRRLDLDEVLSRASPRASRGSPRRARAGCAASARAAGRGSGGAGAAPRRRRRGRRAGTATARLR